VGAEHATLMMYKVQAGRDFGENIFYHDPKLKGGRKVMATSDRESKTSDVTNQLVELIKEISEEKQRFLLDLVKKWAGQKERHARKGCLIPVDYATSDRNFSDYIQDISASGVFIQTKQPFKDGQEVTLAFSVLDTENPFKIVGKIVRSEPTGIAVQFENLTQYREWIIESLLEEMAGEFKK
jgi:Tfp pilus assembly protein PilZ